MQRSSSKLCCKWPKGSSVSSSTRWFSSSHIAWSSAKGSCGSSFAISVSSVSPDSRVWLRRGTRFVWIVATCSSDSLCACKAAARCLPRRVPARFCHPAHPREVGRLLARAADSVPVCFAILPPGSVDCSGHRSSSVLQLPVLPLRFFLLVQVGRMLRRQLVSLVVRSVCASRPPQLQLVMP